MHNLYSQRFNSTQTIYSEFEDLTNGYQQPCIMDLKLGCSVYNPQKLEHQARKYGGTTSATLLFRINGVQVYDSQGEMSFISKVAGRNLNQETLRDTFEWFFKKRDHQEKAQELIRNCIELVNSLQEAVQQCVGYRFYSSSLLLIYEGASMANMQIKFIDFDRVTYDENVTDPHDEIVTALRNLAGKLSEYFIEQ